MPKIKKKCRQNRQNSKRIFGTGAAVVRVLVVRPFARLRHSFACTISPQTTATSTLMPNAVNCAT